MRSLLFLKFVLAVSGILLYSFAVVPVALSLDNHLDCNQCHLLHNGPGSNLLHEANSETVCMSCHDGSVSGAPEVNIHETTDAEFLASCVDCHDTHSSRENYEGGTNISMVGYLQPSGDGLAKIMNNYDNPGVYYHVAFDSTREFWRSVRDEDEGRRVCQVCHTVPTFGRHPMSTDCTASCHKHSDGFMRTSGP